MQIKQALIKQHIYRRTCYIMTHTYNTHAHDAHTGNLTHFHIHTNLIHCYTHEDILTRTYSTYTRNAHIWRQPKTHTHTHCYIHAVNLTHRRFYIPTGNLTDTHSGTHRHTHRHCYIHADNLTHIHFYIHTGNLTDTHSCTHRHTHTSDTLKPVEFPPSQLTAVRHHCACSPARGGSPQMTSASGVEPRRHAGPAGRRAGVGSEGGDTGVAAMSVRTLSGPGPHGRGLGRAGLAGTGPGGTARARTQPDGRGRGELGAAPPAALPAPYAPGQTHR